VTLLEPRTPHQPDKHQKLSKNSVFLLLLFLESIKKRSVYLLILQSSAASPQAIEPVMVQRTIFGCPPAPTKRSFSRILQAIL
jgi:hypothetical protein